MTEHPHATGALSFLTLYAKYLPCLVFVLGGGLKSRDDLATHLPGHPVILDVRDRIALVTSRKGETEKAIDLLIELLPDQVAFYPEGHPAIERTRQAIATLRARLAEQRGGEPEGSGTGTE